MVRKIIEGGVITNKFFIDSCTNKGIEARTVKDGEYIEVYLGNRTFIVKVIDMIY